MRSRCFIVAGVARPLRNLTEDANQVALDRTVSLLKRLQFLAGSAPSPALTAQEHFCQLVTRRRPGFVHFVEDHEHDPRKRLRCKGNQSYSCQEPANFNKEEVRCA